MTKKKLDQKKLEGCLDCACLSYRQASRAVTQLFDDALVPVGLVSVQLPVLVVAGVHGPITISRLAGLLLMDRTTLTRVLKPLQAKGYLRSIATTDKRKNMLELTAKGHEIIVDSHPLWQKAQEQVIQGLKPQSWKSIKQQLGRVVEVANGR